MRTLILRWLIVSAGVYGACRAGEALGLGLRVDPEQPWRVLIAGAAVGLINAVIVPVLRFLTCPLHCLTLGLSTLVINAALFYAVGQMGWGIVVDDIFGALFGVVCVAVISALLGFLLPDGKEDDDEE